MGIGITISMGTVQAWPWLAEKNVKEVLVQEAQKSKAAEFAWASTKLVGKSTAFTLKQGAKFAWNYPYLAISLVAGGYAYCKLDHAIHWINTTMIRMSVQEKG